VPKTSMKSWSRKLVAEVKGGSSGSRESIGNKIKKIRAELRRAELPVPLKGGTTGGLLPPPVVASRRIAPVVATSARLPKRTKSRQQGKPWPEGVQCWECGRRRIIRHDDEVVVATDGVWLISRRMARTEDGWFNGKLIRRANAPKNVWYVSWKDGRFNHNHDWYLLVEHEPERLEWLERMLYKYTGAKSVTEKEPKSASEK